MLCGEADLRDQRFSDLLKRTTAGPGPPDSYIVLFYSVSNTRIVLPYSLKKIHGYMADLFLFLSFFFLKAYYLFKMSLWFWLRSTQIH